MQRTLIAPPAHRGLGSGSVLVTIIGVYWGAVKAEAGKHKLRSETRKKVAETLDTEVLRQTGKKQTEDRITDYRTR